MRIRKFNENISDELINFIEDCFVEFIDEGAYIKDEGQHLEVEIVCDKATNYSMPKNSAIISEKDFIDAYNEYNKFNEVLLNINNCIERIRTKYDESELIARFSIIYIMGKCHIQIYLIPQKTT
jgi:hypothetical protein